MYIDPKVYKSNISGIYKDQFIGEVFDRFEKQINFLQAYRAYLKSLQQVTNKGGDLSSLRRSFSLARIDLLKMVDTHFLTFEAALLDDDFK
ncbi:MAG: hypothetical protein AAF519_02945, partial [Bacteroidota bacterium]